MKDLNYLNDHRVKHQKTDWLGDGKNGCFVIMIKGYNYLAIASNGLNWEHVSVSGHRYPPTWETMCKIKDLFFNDDEVVMQLHPAKADYINNHNNCLHLWRPIGQAIPLPPKQCV